MIQSTCPHCRNFISDYISSGIHPKLAIYKEIRPQVFTRIPPEFTDWCIHILEYFSHCNRDYLEARNSALRIASRGRNSIDYDFLIQTAIFNYLCATMGWVQKQVKYIIPILLESGLFKSKRYIVAKQNAESYIGFILPKLIEFVSDLHTDHLYPKGVNTDLKKIPFYESGCSNHLANIHEMDTLHDKHDCMSEILNDGEDLIFSENDPQ